MSPTANPIADLKVMLYEARAHLNGVADSTLQNVLDGIDRSLESHTALEATLTVLPSDMAHQATLEEKRKRTRELERMMEQFRAPVPQPERTNEEPQRG